MSFLDMIGDPYPDYLDEFMLRIVATEVEQLSRIGPIDSVPFFNYQQPTFPYITHRLGEDLIVEQGDSTQERTYTVISRFVIDHVSAGVNGENERLIYKYEPSIVSLFTQNIYLVSADYPDAIPEMGAMPITFKRASGTKYLDNRANGGNMPGQVGFEYMITAVFNLDIRRRY